MNSNKDSLFQQFKEDFRSYAFSEETIEFGFPGTTKYWNSIDSDLYTQNITDPTKTNWGSIINRDTYEEWFNMISDEILPEIKRKFSFLQITDNEKGMGQTPNNTEIDQQKHIENPYITKGLVVKMKASTFIELAHNITNPDQNYIKEMREKIEENTPIASPTLYLSFPKAWFEDGDFSEPAKVAGHEGRHRCHAILSSEQFSDDAEIEVHLSHISTYKVMDKLTDNMVKSLSSQILSEDGEILIQSTNKEKIFEMISKKFAHLNDKTDENSIEKALSI